MRRHQTFETIIIGKGILIREGISRILSAKNFRVSASVSCPDELTGGFRGQQQLFLIVHTSDDFGRAVEQVSLVRDRYPSGRVVVVVDHYKPTEPDMVYQAGAAGYLASDMSCDAFVKSVELVMMGEAVFPPTFLASALDTERPRDVAISKQNEDDVLVNPEDGIAPPLSPRELAILRCLISGNSNKCIARKIDIAEATVKVHVKAILRKIRVQNRTQAAIWGINHSLLEYPVDGIPHFATANLDGRFD
jgi:two-component system nitrate/nitrite response regulator NarL